MEVLTKTAFVDQRFRLRIVFLSISRAFSLEKCPIIDQVLCFRIIKAALSFIKSLCEGSFVESFSIF